MTEDFLERMRMADQDDDDADLKQLKQLRQVWLAMPDEEPPTRGLDALMAAARTKAEEMQPKTSWWRRMLHAMVRPPALAFATIVVVAGGAVLVHRHHDDLDATASVSARAEERADEGIAGDRFRGATGSSNAAPVPDPEPQLERKIEPKAEAKDVPAVGGQGSAATPPVVVVTPSTTPVTPKPPQVTHAAATPKKPSPPPPMVKADESVDTVVDQVQEAPKHIVLSPQDGRPASKEPPKPDVARPSDAPKAPTSTTRGAPAKSGAAQLATDNEVQNQPEAVDSLLRRAREAASRGDCASAKAIAAKIASQDAAYYRSTAAKDATLAKCL